MGGIELKILSGLEKVFPDETPRATVYTAASALRGETFSFCAAARCIAPVANARPGVFHHPDIYVTVTGDLPLRVREVTCVPVDMPSYQHDADLLRDAPGIFPDPLDELLPGGVSRLNGGLWRAYWITVDIPADARPGDYPLTVTLRDAAADPDATEGVMAATATFTLTVLGAALPPQRLLRYEWLHADCLASVYRTDLWSEEHWRLVEAFAANAARHGVNVLFTPLWTPPLDTAIGHERPTTQLLDIVWEDGRYRFDFGKLERYLDMGLRLGFTHFGMSHAFTQWGATATPKIVVTVDGREEKRFGWHVPATDPAYADFLRQLMAELLPFLVRKGLEGRVFFSVSDEPTEDKLESYAHAARLMQSVIGDWPTLEALSDFAFHQHGLVKRPVPANDHIEPFVGHVPELWTYYCVGQEIDVPNRFIAMSLARVRVMGVLCYLYRVVGFLQWAYNFYYSKGSRHTVDPWRDASGGRWVPAGDSFLVYPGRDGEPVDSIRGEAFHAGLQDYAALQALEAQIGRQAVETLIHEGLGHRLRMDRYPRSAEWLLGLRERVNRLLAKGNL